MERAKASERIMQTSETHDVALKQEMGKLGIAF
jgi:hypothetical protein